MLENLDIQTSMISPFLLLLEYSLFFHGENTIQLKFMVEIWQQGYVPTPYLYLLTFYIFTRQKQYFEQRKKQQQYRPQSDGLEDHTDGIDMVGKHLKEHRSLDVLGLLNLSAIAHECKSACPSGMLLF